MFLLSATVLHLQPPTAPSAPNSSLTPGLHRAISLDPTLAQAEVGAGSEHGWRRVFVVGRAHPGPSGARTANDSELRRDAGGSVYVCDRVRISFLLSATSFVPVVWVCPPRVQLQGPGIGLGPGTREGTRV